ncbi:MAG TPA: glycine zipper 2TM domain-containing protein [Sphingobium sp.]|nr:glycine zipper 2TM domain-containing protein [Sphingobium sp.]
MTARTFIAFGAALALGAGTIAATPAQARDNWNGHGRYEQRYDRHDQRYDRYDRHNRGYDNRVRYQYDNRGYRYNERCRSDGTAGTIIGAIAGGLLGNSVVGRHGDKTAGTIIGGAVGAVAGRAIDKGDDRCR